MARNPEWRVLANTQSCRVLTSAFDFRGRLALTPPTSAVMRVEGFAKQRAENKEKQLSHRRHGRRLWRHRRDDFLRVCKKPKSPRRRRRWRRGIQMNRWNFLHKRITCQNDIFVSEEGKGSLFRSYLHRQSRQANLSLARIA